ncbi:dienelactone hydrolase family protein [Chondromyces apiculatus]|uniref:Tiorf75 protein n=1 Tax=Chondromyces apiculatus DSM 436 TaxID=1192034 RepID=A0A017SZD1_9BACT|nr:dienelactone hydrolase family protein [Chondromyces apiculatus]EYF01651.1 Tiorf75 protein [Chondromyces apiculatus DSM 436]
MPTQTTNIHTLTETFTSGGKPITVEWLSAPGAAPRPAVIVLHGAEGLVLADVYRSAARTLAQAGFQAFFVHYFDRTGSARASYGSLLQSFPLWQETLRDALTWVGMHAGVAPGPIGVVGVSLGAILGLVTAKDEPRIGALVDYFGPLPDGVLDDARALPPTLVLHGDADRLVPLASTRKLEALLKRLGTPHEVVIYPGEGHGFFGDAQRDAQRRTAVFLGRHLAAGAAEMRSAS